MKKMLNILMNNSIVKRLGTWYRLTIVMNDGVVVKLHYNSITSIGAVRQAKKEISTMGEIVSVEVA